MPLSKAYSEYKENSVVMSSPEGLTLMLYNGLVKFVMLARHSIEKDDIEKTNDAIKRAQEIIHELQSSLNKDYEISMNLEALYDYMYRRLMDANIEKDSKILQEVLGFAKDFRDTWVQAMNIWKKQKNNPSPSKG